jgi:hypothetical protein
MRVANIECQIAQGQIGRYLLGEGFSAEALRQLEEHVASCPDCKQVLQARRTALQAMLGGETQPADPVSPAAAEPDEPAAPSGTPNPLLEILRQRTLGLAGRGTATAAVMVPADSTGGTPQQTLEPVPGQSGYWKPLVYSGALALVLILMSYMSKAPAALLGEKALPAGAAVEAAPSQDTPILGTPPESTDPDAQAALEEEPSSELAEEAEPERSSAARASGRRTSAAAAEDPPAEPRANVRSQRPAAPRQPAARPTRSQDAPRQQQRAPVRQAPPQDTIRVYAPEGG